MMGTVFDIKEFSLHDGPGARITVFFKGCPLRCLWCHNPEGLSPQKQIMYKSSICVDCGRCRIKCEHEDCKPYGRCLHACPSGCLELAGFDYTADELSKKLLSYKPILDTLGGGVTFSGGEPLMQAEFLFELLDKLKDKIHIAIETCGYAKADVFSEMLKRVDLVIMDIKIADRELHKTYTGVFNDLILNNFNLLKESGKAYLIRIPLIPGYTDTEDNLRRISDIIGNSPCELLSYNPLASVKYSQVGASFMLEAREANAVDLGFFKNATVKKI